MLWTYPVGRGNLRPSVPAGPGRGPEGVSVHIYKVPGAPFPRYFIRTRLRGVGPCSQEVAQSEYEPRSAWLSNQLFRRNG